jgi:hypothetical protein
MFGWNMLSDARYCCVVTSFNGSRQRNWTHGLRRTTCGHYCGDGTLGGASELSVWVTFLLLNDSEATLNVSAESWKIVIDGEELRDSDYLFGNGVMPEGGYRNLRPGATYSLGKALSLSKYFPEQREYRISWKGKNFQSPTITFIAPAERIEK